MIKYKHHQWNNKLLGYKLLDNVLYYNTEHGIGSITFKNPIIAKRCMEYLIDRAKTTNVKAISEFMLLDRVNRKHRELGYRKHQTWVAQFAPTSIN